MLEDKALILYSAIDACRCCEDAGFGISKPAGMKRGPEQSRVMAIGLAPGRSAIQAEKAFAGNSGNRLISWFVSAGFPMNEDQFRASVYLTSLNKCGVSPDTPHNRRQLWGHCASFLWQQIELVKPELILVLGQETAELLGACKKCSWRHALGTKCATEELFEGDLFPPTCSAATWLFLPHPSGLSRTMNDSANSTLVIQALKQSLCEIEFKPMDANK